MSSNIHTLRPMKKAIRSLINQRANDLGALFANQHAKPWIYDVVLAAGADLMDDGAVDRLAELITPLALDEWRKAADAPLIAQIQRAEMECRRLMGELDDLKQEVERLRATSTV